MKGIPCTALGSAYPAAAGHRHFRAVVHRLSRLFQFEQDRGLAEFVRAGPGGHDKCIGAVGTLASAPAVSTPAASSSVASAPAAKGTVTSLTVQDYYNYEPDEGIFGDVLNACGASIGVKIQRDIVPGASYIPKVLQEGSSHTLPDVLMLDNPDVPHIASTGAFTPLSQFGLSASGSVAGVVAASTYQGQLYGLQPVANTIALFYNKDALSKAGVTPPTTWAELQTAAKKLVSGSQYGIAFAAPATGEATWTFLPFMWSNGGDEKDIATQQTADALQQWVDLVKDGAASKSVLTWTQGDVLDQFTAGKAAMMINGPWQLPALNAIKGLNYGVVPIPAPAAGKPTIGPLGGETWTVPNTGNAAREAAAPRRRVLVLRPEPAVAGITAPDRPDQDCAPGAVHRGQSLDDSLQWPGRRSPVPYR